MAIDVIEVNTGIQGPTGATGATGPQGPKGDPGDGIVGTGSPLGVVSAPVGTLYTDTASTNGAIRWFKKTGSGNTGWIVIYGDTGWRSLIDGSRAILNNVSGWRTDLNGANRSLLQIRRVGSQVSIAAWEIYPPLNSTTYWGQTQPRQGGITSIPAGFRGKSAASWSAQPGIASWNNNSYQNQNALGSAFPLYGNATLDGWPDVNVLTIGAVPTGTTSTWQVSLNMQYDTSDAWPTSLPGTAAP